MNDRRAGWKVISLISADVMEFAANGKKVSEALGPADVPSVEAMADNS